MTNDFILRISSAAGNNLHFFLTAANPKLVDVQIKRQGFTLKREEIDQLRMGEPSEALTKKVAAEITDWLVGGEVAGYLNIALDAAEADTLRLVLRVDDELLPALADIPIELLYFRKNWFALEPKVSSIVHQLKKETGDSAAAGPQAWPLRVLVVRSNPSDLGGAVPEAAPICEAVINLTEHLGPNAVLVDLLSREASALLPSPQNDEWPLFRKHLLDRGVTTLAPPAWKTLQHYLKATHYDILVYLGHGDLPETDGGSLPVGRLEFEAAKLTEDGAVSHPISADQLKYELLRWNHAVPVILLAGCLTAAQFHAIAADRQEALLASLPDMMRGSQGVAQMLVSSDAGVHFAVGMRYKLETQMAVDFLQAFFTSLLSDRPGHVEAAVRAGRMELMTSSGQFPPSWSAPVVFRTLGKEPMFEYMNSLPKYAHTAVDLRDQEYRENTWAYLVTHPGIGSAYEVLDKAEVGMRDRALKEKSAVLFAERVEVKVDEPLPPLFVRLYGSLAVEEVRVTLSVGSEKASIKSINSTDALKGSGYKLEGMTEAGGPQISFTLKWAQPGVPPAPLPEDRLIQAQLEIAQPAAAPYHVMLGVETKPPKAVRAINNAVLVSLV